MPANSRENGVSLEDRAYQLLTASAVTLIAAGTIVYRIIEDWSWVDSLYFSVIAVTTVGFGDITPSTDASKLFTVVYVLGGIAIITTYLHMRLKHRTGKSRYMP